MSEEIEGNYRCDWEDVKVTLSGGDVVVAEAVIYTHERQFEGQWRKVTTVEVMGVFAADTLSRIAGDDWEDHLTEEDVKRVWSAVEA